MKFKNVRTSTIFSREEETKLLQEFVWPTDFTRKTLKRKRRREEVKRNETYIKLYNIKFKF